MLKDLLHENRSEITHFDEIDKVQVAILEENLKIIENLDDLF